MPKIIAWYKIFCYLFTLFNLSLLGIAIWFIVRHDQLANSVVSSTTVLVAGIVCTPLASVLTFLNIWLIVRPPTKKAWTVHMGNIAAGLSTFVLVPLALPLLILWFRPEVRQWYDSNS